MRATALKMVHELARQDPRVVFIGSDLGAGTMAEMAEQFPERTFMEGISEANIVGMAAGMAMEGYIPYLNTIAPFFTRRAFEQIAVDLCLQNLPVRLIASGGGLVYAPLGPTHMAIEDIAVMRALPNMTVVAVSDAEEMRRLMAASLAWPGPLYIRVAKGGDRVVSQAARGFAIGRAIEYAPPGDVALITTGVMLGRAQEAAELLRTNGIIAGILHIHTVKPLDVRAVHAAASRARLVVTIEEHSRIGGLGSAVLETLADRRDTPMKPMLRLGIPDLWPDEYGSQESLLEKYGLTAGQIAGRVRQALQELPAQGRP